MENRRAREKGCSYVVEEVTPKDRDFVTAAMAAIAGLACVCELGGGCVEGRLGGYYNGSEMGNCDAPGSTGSMFSGPL